MDMVAESRDRELDTSLTYVIGDVHGRFDLLMRAGGAIMAHKGTRRGQIILLGDYVDRGPQSRNVVEFLMSAQQSYPGARLLCLKGNHEDLMICAYREHSEASLRQWMFHGGDATLASYGWRGGETPDIRNLIPEEHIIWMEGLPFISADKHRIYVHAGIAPGSALEDQDEQTCLWIRERFLRGRAREFSKHVVHGHTPVSLQKPDAEHPELLPHRTNLDSGAYLTGILLVGAFLDHKPGGPADLLRVAAEGAAPVKLKEHRSAPSRTWAFPLGALAAAIRR